MLKKKSMNSRARFRRSLEENIYEENSFLNLTDSGLSLTIGNQTWLLPLEILRAGQYSVPQTSAPFAEPSAPLSPEMARLQELTRMSVRILADKLRLEYIKDAKHSEMHHWKIGESLKIRLPNQFSISASPPTTQQESSGNGPGDQS